MSSPRELPPLTNSDLSAIRITPSDQMNFLLLVPLRIDANIGRGFLSARSLRENLSSPQLTIPASYG